MGYIMNLVVAVSLLVLPVSSTTSPTPPTIAPERPIMRQVESKSPTPSQIALIKSKSVEYGVSESLMTKIISCESGFNEYALGDFGQSRGLVQIHKPSHPTITDEQAYNAEFSVDFLADNLSQGKGEMWTCFRILSGSS
jgi:hypothetical protein